MYFLFLFSFFSLTIYRRNNTGRHWDEDNLGGRGRGGKRRNNREKVDANGWRDHGRNDKRGRDNYRNNDNNTRDRPFNVHAKGTVSQNTNNNNDINNSVPELNTQNTPPPPPKPFSPSPTLSSISPQMYKQSPQSHPPLSPPPPPPLSLSHYPPPPPANPTPVQPWTQNYPAPNKPYPPPPPPHNQDNKVCNHIILFLSI